MFRTQIYLTEEEKHSLQIIGRETGKSQSMLIREAIDFFIHQLPDILSEKSRQRTKILQSAKGLWSKREDLPDFDVLRKSFNRKQKDNDETAD